MFMKSILAVFLLLLCACDNLSQQQLKAEQVDGRPFVLIARLHALPGQDEALLTLSAAVDKKFEQG